MLKGFKEFIARGNVIELAVGVIIGAAFKSIVDSLVDILFERAATARGEDVRPDSTTGVGPFHTVCPDSCCRNGAGHPGRPTHHGTDSADPR